MWSYYDCCHCLPSVNTICGRIGLSLIGHNIGRLGCRCPSVNTICGRIMIGLSSVSKHNMWSYYDWVYCCCLPSVNTICGRIMIGLSLLSSVSKHNMWSYYDWVVVVVVRQ